MAEAAWLVLSNQLFPATYFSRDKASRIFMAEDRQSQTRFRFHQQRIAFFLAAMRHRADAFREDGFRVDYVRLEDQDEAACLEDLLARFVSRHEIGRLICHEIEELFMERRIEAFCDRHGIALEVLPSPMFLTPRETFAEYLSRRRRPFMKTFYEEQRRRLDILIDGCEPVGGRWSFDTENRKKLPKKQRIPDPPTRMIGPHDRPVERLVENLFPDHPGKASNAWLPTTRAGSTAWLEHFLDFRLPLFGPYEDALTERHDMVFHAVLTPMLNAGLLTPEEIVRSALSRAEREPIPLQSLEGFIRQVIGWREFIRGIYRHYDEIQRNRNHWGHMGALRSCWYDASTGLDPLDAVIGKVGRLGWCHHIERLMVLGNLMLLCEVHPIEAYRWFMEMFIDASEWVMGPNVFGMSQFSDGGIFATKPYICGSSYILKMSDYGKGDWCEVMDGLYWRFIARNRETIAGNPRMSMMARMLDRLEGRRRDRIIDAAERFIERVTARDGLIRAST